VNSAVHIRPGSGFKLIDLPELWRYRDLGIMLAWRDFAIQYQQTILGPIWFILQPILPTIVYTFVFGTVAGISTEGVPPILFFLASQVAWGYFQASYNHTAHSLMGNIDLFSKVYFPRLIVPFAKLASSGVTAMVQLGMFAVAWLWFRSRPAGVDLEWSLSMLGTPLIFVLIALQGMAFGLWMAVLTAKYRDLAQLSGVLIQLWMYASAVVFPVSAVPERYRDLLLLNPPTFLMEAVRSSLLGIGSVSSGTALYSMGVTVPVLLGGFWVYNRTARTFVDIA
jgi:lipopolysaccharide transport system permease protein